MNREDVYKAIDSERAYQNKRWGSHNRDGFHSPEAYIIYMEHHLDIAKHALSTEHVNQSYPEAMDEIRKVAALAVCCMENHGARERSEWPPPGKVRF